MSIRRTFVRFKQIAVSTELYGLTEEGVVYYLNTGTPEAPRVMPLWTRLTMEAEMTDVAGDEERAWTQDRCRHCGT
jgi:hypothetical protein